MLFKRDVVLVVSRIKEWECLREGFNSVRQLYCKHAKGS